jgi:hypothetical protein
MEEVVLLFEGIRTHDFEFFEQTLKLRSLAPTKHHQNLNQHNFEKRSP